MSLLDLARRAAGKSPSYLAQRAVLEMRRRAGARRLRARLAALDASVVARELGAPTLADFFRRRGAAGFLYCAGDLARLRALHGEEPLAAHRARLADRAERLLHREVDLLGSGPVALGAEIDWHRDFKSGRRWPLRPAHAIDYAELGQPSDVKVPWELSRCQHLPTLARWWAVAGDPRAPREVRAQVESWISANPVGVGVNWACTMDVALRAVSWVWTLAILGADAGGAASAGIGTRSPEDPLPSPFLECALVSLYAHGLWIPAHLEVGEVNGNHFLSDALGMVACGSLFAGSRSGDRWLADGMRLLEREIAEQVNDDGTDIEASVPYHRLVLEIFLVAMRLAAAAGHEVSVAYRERVRAMLRFVDAYVTPEGLSPVVGDADDGRALVLGDADIRDHRYLLPIGALLFDDAAWARRAAAQREDALWLLGPGAAARLDALAAGATREASRDSEREASAGAAPAAARDAAERAADIPTVASDADPRPAIASFRDGGFHVLRTARQYLFVDAGSVGFRGRGGHGHNDCLSFEWHALGRPLLADSGAYVYTASVEWRNRFRSTAFHNAIRIDAEEINRLPSELALWSLCDDARPIDVASGEDDAVVWLRAGHTGYRRLSDPVTVRRCFSLARDAAALRIDDRIEARGEHLVEVFFHAAPGARANPAGAGGVALEWPDGTRLAIAQHAGPRLEWRIEGGWFSPSYGVKVARPVCVARGRVAGAAELAWALVARAGAPARAGTTDRRRTRNTE